jgi:tetratricopeptide (TPR) repeat protein
MATSRLEVLKSMVAQNPGDSFARYGLAMEYRGAGDLEAAAVEFQALLAANPDYAGAYFHYGQTLLRAGRKDEAREVYRQGVEVTTRLGNSHARGELEGALELLG